MFLASLRKGAWWLRAKVRSSQPVWVPVPILPLLDGTLWASVSPYELIDAECLEQGLAPRKCPTVPAISVLLFERWRAAQADMDSWDH